MTVKYDSYKGNPMIVLDADTKYPFQFGVKKAHMILAHLDAIRAFAAAHPLKQTSQASNGGSTAFDRAVEDQMANQAGVGNNQPGRF